MKKSILTALMFLLSISIFAENGIVLLHNLGYYSSEDKSYKGKNSFGDKLKLTGETKKVPSKSGEFLCKEYEKNGENFLTSSYFVVGNSTEGVIRDRAFVYKLNDLSSPSDSLLNPMTFVAVDADTVNDDLVKISYLSKAKNGWAILDGFVKKEFLSLSKDDWGSAQKYFIATQQDSIEKREDWLNLAQKRHKSSIFKELIQSMIDEDHLRVVENDLSVDENFAGTDDFLTSTYNVVLYVEADTISEVLYNGPAKIKLNKRSLNKISSNGITDYMYNVTTESGETGWVHGLN